MEAGPVCRPGNRPRMLMCYLCGREYGTRSLPIHIPQCQRKWLLEEESKPKNERRPLPPQPNVEFHAMKSGGAQAFDNFNNEAFAAFEQTMQQCPHCQRRFLPKPFLRHQNGCTAANPAKPAGTGLIPISLTNRLVPGAVAGSTHGKARTQHVPLRLCKPASEKLNSKLKSQSRPASASARPLWTNAEDTFSFDDGHSGQSSHWRDALCVEPRTRNRLQSSRPSSQGNVGTTNGGGEKSTHLVDMFGNLWRTHSWEENSVPMITRHKSAAQEQWCSQAETDASVSMSRAANPRPKTARFASECCQSPRAIMRSSPAPPREQSLLDLLGHSGQAAHKENYKRTHGKTGGDLRHHQRRHHEIPPSISDAR